jgi:hypothetical protein
MRMFYAGLPLPKSLPVNGSGADRWGKSIKMVLISLDVVLYLTPIIPRMLRIRSHTRRGDLIAVCLPLSVAWRGGRGVR